jgi:hypothetical protein
VLLTRSPLEYPRKGLSARLACVKHAASVRPEPGSNSPTKTCQRHPSKQKICQRNPTNPTKRGRRGIKPNLALAYTNTLLSSQRTNTHHNQNPHRGGPARGATRPTYPVDFAASSQIFGSTSHRPRGPRTATRRSPSELVLRGKPADRPISAWRHIRPAPAGLTTLPGRPRNLKSDLPVDCAARALDSAVMSVPRGQGESYADDQPNANRFSSLSGRARYIGRRRGPR